MPIAARRKLVDRLTSDLEMVERMVLGTERASFVMRAARRKR